MCGIFAWAGKDPRKFNKTKLDILGIYNEVRGGHSCGIAKDGEISIGIDKNKAYKDFLATTGYDAPKKYPVVIGHTRQSTYGAHTVANAHPFGFGIVGEGYEFMGCHNGTLLNHHDLAIEFGIDTNESVSGSVPGVKVTRSKIDSEILLEIIYKTKKYKVLSAYNGAAALVWTDVNKPNVIYCYHGKSRKRDFVNLEQEEERPLYYWQETKNSLFVSSMESSLSAIGGNEDTIKEFEFNTVYEITDGNIDTAKKIKITRLNRFQTGVENTKKDYCRNLNQESSANHARQDIEDEWGMRSWEPTRNRTILEKEVEKAHNKSTEFSGKEALDLKDAINNNIYTENTLRNSNSYGKQVYFNKLRYWRTGHRINGVFCYIANFGFYFLGYSVKESETRFWDIVNKPFVNDDFTTPDKIPAMDLDSVTYPFEHTAKNEITNPPLFFMYDGIKVKTAADYIACSTMESTKEKVFTFEQLSHCSSHPIMDIEEKYKPYSRQEVMFEGVPVTNVFCPLGAERIYTFENGNCINMQPIVTVRRLEEENSTVNQTKLALVIDNLEKIEEDLSALPVNVNSNNDLLEDDINDMFKESLRKFPQYIKKLDTYGAGRGFEASNILKEFVNKATTLVAIEEKE